MNCIIVDDEATSRMVINQLCSQAGGLQIDGEFENAILAIKYLNQHDVDLIFLDIHMPDFTGFDFIQTLKNPPKIVLITSDTQFAIDAFEYDCIVDYMVKPIALPRFLKAVKKVENAMLSSGPTKVEAPQENSQEKPTTASPGKDLYVNIDRRLVKINIPDIYLIEAKGDYIQIKTETKNYVVHSTLKKIEEKLPKDIFLKTHRSYVINTKMIIDIEDNSVLIKKDVVPVSRSNRPELMKRLNLL
ncbi:LytR family transcriptional regulator [Wenyingzhuangia fucanilytica]|uniref:LytR family transcriptional regulator n=1 Tax=Wenyingzhuangia fucanilytica TaxID=1790137 RepID=A0A1B1Y854_9FLAO|nr:LytTR family DNA-binding domain-containing protein [Wenyingzhuangia fucanilytica]ANW96908.1 LytR family transcriptional regulator [Wenyingzhuangia fucanilytica]